MTNRHLQPWYRRRLIIGLFVLPAFSVGLWPPLRREANYDGTLTIDWDDWSTS